MPEEDSAKPEPAAAADRIADIEAVLAKLRQPKRNVIRFRRLVADGELEYALTLRDVGVARIIGREVLDLNARIGRLGFFGLLLAPNMDFPAEWLILSMSWSGLWLLLDGRWVSATGYQPAMGRPLIDLHGQWDELSPLIVGARLSAAKVEANTSLFMLQKGVDKHRLEVPEQVQRLESYLMPGETRQWYPEESLWDAWVICDVGEFS